MAAYDAAILDIMGVRGYDLLQLANEKEIPALMLTAHALSPDNLVKSIKEGARSYIPKDKISDITIYLAEMLDAHQKGIKKHRGWFAKLKPFFDKKFGKGWKEKHPQFWREFDHDYVISMDELDGVI
jgi:DNA-binding NtrC family response regulator